MITFHYIIFIYIRFNNSLSLELILTTTIGDDSDDDNDEDIDDDVDEDSDDDNDLGTSNRSCTITQMSRRILNLTTSEMWSQYSTPVPPPFLKLMGPKGISMFCTFIC